MSDQHRAGGLDGQLLTPSDIGDVNRSRVLQAFCDHGPLSRADLAKMAGVTRATIGNIVASLLESGLIEEGEAIQTGSVGKPGRPLWFGERAGLTGAVSITPGTIVAALVNARGELLDEATSTFDADGNATAIASVVSTSLRAALPKNAREILGIGVAVPGVCNTKTGAILGSGPVPGIAGSKLFETLTSKFDLPVLIDNDSRAQALGEKWFGRGKGVASFASIQTGHGIGVGLVMGGVVVRGAHGEAGEAGHTAVVMDGELCRCGLRGCWETIATVDWLRAQATEAKLSGASKIDAAKLTELAKTDASARALLERYADNIAVGLASIAQLLSPGLFILHGDAAGGGETFRTLVEEKMRARVFAHIGRSTDVVLSELDHRATVLGAAGLVLSETFHLVA
ncbi:MAG: ROK family transcriptional regulator [Actinomycetota bacterium]